MSISLIAAALLASLTGATGPEKSPDACASFVAPAKGILPRPPGAEIYKRVGNAYVTASTYSDEGTVTVELKPPGAAMIVERAAFRTRYSRPKRFLFEFRREGADESFVVWSPEARFNTWWSATGVHEEYREGEGAHAFGVSAAPTMNAVLVIAPMLFWDSGLEGPVRSMREPSLLGHEVIDGQCHYRIGARIRLNHWGDADRMTTLWVGTKDFLVRKIVEDTPSNAAGGQIERTTITMKPLVGAAIPASKFAFSPN